MATSSFSFKLKLIIFFKCRIIGVREHQISTLQLTSFLLLILWKKKQYTACICNMRARENYETIIYTKPNATLFLGSSNAVGIRSCEPLWLEDRPIMWWCEHPLACGSKPWLNLQLDWLDWWVDGTYRGRILTVKKPAIYSSFFFFEIGYI